MGSRLVTYEKFLTAFQIGWTRLRNASGREPTVIVVGVDKMAKIVRRCLDDLFLDAHVIIDPEAPEGSLLMTDETAMADMPGNAVHREHGHLLGGGKN
jgi:hypothetical protein